MHTCIYNYIHNIHIWASVNTLRTVKSTAAPLLLEGGARLISLFSSNDTYPEWYPLITYIASICLCIKSVLFTRCCNKFWRSKERPRLDMIGPAASWDWRGFECYYNCSCFHFHRRQWLFVAAISTSALYIYISFRHCKISRNIRPFCWWQITALRGKGWGNAWNIFHHLSSILFSICRNQEEAVLQSCIGSTSSRSEVRMNKRGTTCYCQLALWIPPQKQRRQTWNSVDWS